VRLAETLVVVLVGCAAPPSVGAHPEPPATVTMTASSASVAPPPQRGWFCWVEGGPALEPGSFCGKSLQSCNFTREVANAQWIKEGTPDKRTDACFRSEFAYCSLPREANCWLFLAECEESKKLLGNKRCVRRE